MDLKLDERTWDIVFVNGENVVTKGMVDIVAQRLTIRLKTFLAEWFLNVEYGVPWDTRILGQKVKKSAVDIILQDQIYSERGVSRISHFRSSMNGTGERKYSLEFRVVTTDGEETSIITI